MTKKKETQSSNQTEEDVALEEGLLQSVDDDTKGPESIPDEAMSKGAEF
jgi:hypothetical protein